MHIYLISGLGADERLFQHMEFPEDTTVHYLPWVSPVSKKESLQSYCKRLMWKMDTGRPHIIIGISFGGMVAQELARLTNPLKVILIASIKQHIELPPYFKVMKLLNIWHLPPKAIKSLAKGGQRIFGQHGKEAYIMFADMVDKTPDPFVPWAIRQVLTWQNTDIHPNLIQLHGTIDKMFPAKFIQGEYISIEGATHAMTLFKPNEVNSILAEQFSSIER